MFLEEDKKGKDLGSVRKSRESRFIYSPAGRGMRPAASCGER